MTPNSRDEPPRLPLRIRDRKRGWSKSLWVLTGSGWLIACARAPIESAEATEHDDPTGVSVGTASDGDAASAPDASVPPEPLDLHLVYVHGVGDPDSYARSHNALADLDEAVLERIDGERPNFEASTGRKLVVTSHRFNLYTDAAGNLASPGTDDGSADEVAYKWRSRLAEKLAAAFPNHEKNIVLIGHSTGARASMEVAADVGGPDDALGAADWGFRERIAGVVSVHGMIDALSRYEVRTGVVHFEFGCKFVKPSGWCGYAANVSGVPAADWVATQRHSLMLTSVVRDGRCGQSLWDEPADQTLPLRAQGSPAAFGLGLAADRDGIYRPAHGVQYGEFCHSEITDPGKPRHRDAVASASKRIAEWLFESAPRVVNPTVASQTYDTPVLRGLTSSAPFIVSSSCPEGTVRLGPLEVVGNCHHPGYFDGDDHPMTAEQIISSADATCGGTVQWKNTHDHPHSGTLWFKSYATTERGVLFSLRP
jgi:hypothetical protein